jgi:hypothetical protein
MRRSRPAMAGTAAVCVERPVRNVLQYVNDLNAQIAANEKGAQELRKMTALPVGRWNDFGASPPMKFVPPCGGWRVGNVVDGRLGKFRHLRLLACRPKHVPCTCLPNSLRLSEGNFSTSLVKQHQSVPDTVLFALESGKTPCKLPCGQGIIRRRHLTAAPQDDDPRDIASRDSDVSKMVRGAGRFRLWGIATRLRPGSL